MEGRWQKAGIFFPFPPHSSFMVPISSGILNPGSCWQSKCNLREASIRIQLAHGVGSNRVNHKRRLDQSMPEAYTFLDFSL